MNKKLIGGIVILIVVAGGSFLLGKISGSKVSARGGQFTAGQFGGTTRGALGARTGSGMTVGQVLSVDAGSMTLQMADGSTKIVLLGDSTMIEKTIPGTSTDLAKGTPISVVGTTNGDGSITASSVQIRTASTTRPQ